MKPFLFSAMLLMAAPTMANELQLPSIFSDGAVLQRDKPLPIFGGAAPGERVTVQLGAQSQSAQTDADGRWKVTLQAQPVGGPHELRVKGAAQTLTRRDLWMGEVWLLGGQSNMRWSLNSTPGGAGDAARANDPKLRLFLVEMRPAATPQTDVGGRWRAASPDSTLPFSAIGYYFAQRLRREFGPQMPIGLIRDAWDGTRIEPWISREVLRQNAVGAPIAAKAEADALKQSAKRAGWDAQYAEELAAFQTRQSALELQIARDDVGLKAGWGAADFDDGTWATMAVAGRPDPSAAGQNGAFWYRRPVEIPASWAGRDLSLRLGRVAEAAQVFFNGQAVGTLPQVAWEADTPSLRVPAAIVKADTNSLAVRVLDYGGAPGGLGGAEFQFGLAPSLARAGDGEILPLFRNWKWKVGTAFASEQGAQRPTPRPGFWETSTAAGALYDGMIAPIAPYALRGALWYQGESNTAQADAYKTLFPLLISSWREAWNDSFPFLWVQLANYQKPQSQPEDSDWARLREAQLQTLSVPGTAMALAIDLGEADNIHPGRKREVAERLALAALQTAYGRAIESSGPLFQKITTENGALRLHFSHAKGLKVRGDALGGFAIAGEDRVWKWAPARIEGENVVVMSPDVPAPVAVRYAWATNPDTANLYNGADLPASPFRTDSWEKTPAPVK